MDWSKLWQVGTRLVSDTETDKWKVRGFVPDLPGSNVFFATDKFSHNKSIVSTVKKPMYLCCPYDETDEFLGNTYEGQCLGKTFRYRLKRNYTFIREIEQDLLAQAASIYRIDKPLIFAPDARRAVDVCVIDGLTPNDFADYATKKDEKLHIDAAALERAGWQIDLLNGKLRVNDCLILTNVTQSKKALDFMGDGEDESGHYFDAQGNLPDRTLILPQVPVPNHDIRKIVSDKSGRPFRVYVNDNVDLRTYQTLTFDAPEADDWVNVYQEGNELPRLRTAGDIDEFCQRFSDKNRTFNCFFSRVAEPGETAPKNIIRRYERRDRYPDPGEAQELFRARRYRPICYLSFVGERQYLIDWAEYVLSAFEKCYPEFLWAGVYNDT